MEDLSAPTGPEGSKKRRRMSDADESLDEGDELPTPTGGGGEKKRKRRRSRNRRDYKPYSKLSWEEKQALEEKDEEKLRKLLTAPVLPKDSKGRVPRGVRIADYRPPAPKNTTQFITDEQESLMPQDTTKLIADDDFLKPDFSIDDHGSMAGFVRKRKNSTVSNPDDPPEEFGDRTNVASSPLPMRSPVIDMEFNEEGLDEVIKNSSLSFLTVQLKKQLHQAQKHFQENEELKEMLEDKNEIIERLKNELQEKNAEVKSLRARLDEALPAGKGGHSDEVLA